MKSEKSKTPNIITQQTMEDTDQEKNIIMFNSIEELFNDLGI